MKLTTILAALFLTTAAAHLEPQALVTPNAVEARWRGHAKRILGAVVIVGFSLAMVALGLPPLLLVGMAYGTNDAAITTNDLLKHFDRELIRSVHEKDAFAPFFKQVPKPSGVDKELNFVIDSTVNEADQQPPGTPRIGKKREGYEVSVFILDKYREAAPITWEKIRKGRFAEVPNAVEAVANAMTRRRVREAGRFLLTAAAHNSGTPTDPAAPAAGETPNWWNSNDTVAPPTYGENTFSAGHDHVETGGGSAISADRLVDLRKLILEHGYGQNGVLAAMNIQEEVSTAKLANVAQQNVTLSPEVRAELQRAGAVSGLTGFLGMTYLVSNYVPPGALGMWDLSLASLPQGGAVRVEELPLSPDSEVDKDKQVTWVEATEQYGYGILHKGAGLTAHIA